MSATPTTDDIVSLDKWFLNTYPDSNSLPHVADGKTSQRWIVSESLDTHRLRWYHLDDGSITRLDELRSIFNALTRTPIDFLQELGEFASNVGGVAVEDWRIACADLARVIKNDDLGIEGIGALGRIVLRITSNITTPDFLDGNVLYVETNIVSRKPFNKLLQ